MSRYELVYFEDISSLNDFLDLTNHPFKIIHTHISEKYENIYLLIEWEKRDFDSLKKPKLG